MKKLIKILEAIFDNKLNYNLISEFDQVRIELLKNNNYINNFVITENNKILINFEGYDNFSETTVDELINYIKNI